MYISEFTQNGEITVQFSESLRSMDQMKGLNLTMISNEFMFEVDYKTYVDDQYVGEESVPELLDWQVIFFGSNYMKFKLDFSNPLLVSTGEEKDQLDIYFKFSDLFNSALDDRTLEDDFKLFAEVPNQMKSEEDYLLKKSYTDSSKTFMNTTIILTIVLKFVLKLVMPLVLGSIMYLQLVTNVTYYDNVQTPG